MAEGSKTGALQAHFAEYVSRYVVLASIVLVPLAGLVGDAAASVGPDSRLGHTLLSVSSAIGTAAAIAVWLVNRGRYEAAPFAVQATAQAAAAAAGSAAAAAVTGSQGLPVAGSLTDPEVDAVPAHELPSDDVELGAPPPPAPDESNMPVQPSQTGLTDPGAPTDLPT
jgi:hypothetical protein